MSDDSRYTLEGARDAARRDDLAGWVADFLASPGSDNDVLAEQLPRELGWWAGPVQLPIHRLQRLAGPSGDPVLVPVDDDYWDERVDEIGEKAEEGWEPAPVIVAFRGEGDLIVEDGNHRLEGLRRAGREEAWSVVGFETEAGRDRFASEYG